MGACLQMNVEKNDARLFEESQRTLQKSWELIPPETLKRLINITGWTEEKGCDVQHARSVGGMRGVCCR